MTIFMHHHSFESNFVIIGQKNQTGIVACAENWSVDYGYLRFIKSSFINLDEMKPCQLTRQHIIKNLEYSDFSYILSGSHGFARCIAFLPVAS